MSGRGTPAVRALEASGCSFTVHEYRHDPAAASYGEEAAVALGALGIEPDQVFKTLIAAVDGRLTVAVVPVPGQLDLKALAAACGGKRATLAEAAAAERSTGYVLGGISPLGQRTTLPTVVDSSALEHATVLVSAGRRGLDVELAPHDLVALTSATTADLSRSNPAR